MLAIIAFLWGCVRFYILLKVAGFATCYVALHVIMSMANMVTYGDSE